MFDAFPPIVIGICLILAMVAVFVHAGWCVRNEFQRHNRHPTSKPDNDETPPESEPALPHDETAEVPEAQPLDATEEGGSGFAEELMQNTSPNEHGAASTNRREEIALSLPVEVRPPNFLCFGVPPDDEPLAAAVERFAARLASERLTEADLANVVKKLANRTRNLTLSEA